MTCDVVRRTWKISLLAVLLLTYKQSLPTYFKDGLFAIIVLGFISIKLIFFLRGIDVLAYPEKHISYVLFGGLVDDIQMWAEGSTEDEDTNRPK